MKSRYTSSLRQRRVSDPHDTAVDFCPNVASVDERDLAELLGPPSLKTCIYRANEFLIFLYERLSAIAYALIPWILSPLIIGMIYTYFIMDEIGKKVNRSEQGNIPYNKSYKQSLQFVLVVTFSCLTFVIFTIAVDFSKVSRMHKQYKKLNKTQTQDQEDISVIQTDKTQLLYDFISRATNTINWKGSNESLSDSHANPGANEIKSINLLNMMEEKPESNWWETYSILRLNLHCFLYLIKNSIGKLLKRIGCERKSELQRGLNVTNRKRTHYMIRQLVPNSISIAICCAGIVTVQLVSLAFSEWPEVKNPIWQDNEKIWSAIMAMCLMIHFVTLLVLAGLASSSPSNIYLLGILGRWLIILVLSNLYINMYLAVRHKPDCLMAKLRNDGWISNFVNLGGTSIGSINAFGGASDLKHFVTQCLVSAIFASALYQFKITQLFMSNAGIVFKILLDISPVETFVMLIYTFFSPLKPLIFIMPFLGKLSESELFSIFVMTLTTMPTEDNEYWNYSNSSVDQVLEASTSSLHTGIPKYRSTRNAISMPLTILFSRILYPSSRKFGIRPSMYRRLESKQCGRPFTSLGESLSFFVSHTIRAMCRYVVAVGFFQCIEFMVRFALHMILNFKEIFKLHNLILRLLSLPIALLTDLSEVYPSDSPPVSHFILLRFLYPKTSFAGLFMERSKHDNDTYFTPNGYHRISATVKEITVSGSLCWTTIIMFLTFTTDCLHTERRPKLGFIIRGFLGAVLVYAGLNNMIQLICKPAVLRKLYVFSRYWFNDLNLFRETRNFTNCLPNE